MAIPAPMATIMPQIAFTTLGMFIIDEIDYGDTSTPRSWLIGGAGTFAALGARITTGRDDARRVGWIIDMGSDFPTTFKDIVESWNTSCLFRADGNRLTTRAWNGYDENEERDFKYLTPKLRLDQDSLPPSHIFASSFHFVCSASRAIDLVHGIIERRLTIDAGLTRPLFVWEPVPDLCVPAEKEKFLEACKLVDIVSPNQRELVGFFGDDVSNNEDLAIAKVLESGVGQACQGEGEGVLIVRADRRGCYAYQGNRLLHMPAYHLPVGTQGGNSKAVVDPTGGGNAFLGGVAIALVGSRDLIEGEMNEAERIAWEDKAACWGKYHNIPSALIHANIAAGLAIEQAGVPVLSGNECDKDIWNGEEVETRIKSYVSREKRYILKQAREW